MSLDRSPAEVSSFASARKAGAVSFSALSPASSASDPVTLVDALSDHAEPAAALMKALSHEGRLMILCHLAAGEKSVGELEGLTSQRQAAVSQQLARLRLEGLVTTRREGKAIIYSLRDTRMIGLLTCLPKLFSRAA